MIKRVFNFVNRKTVFLFIISLMLSSQIVYAGEETSETVKIKKPIAGFAKKKLVIKNWKPPSGLSTHFGDGTWQKNDPIIIFNLSISFLRYYMKSDVDSQANFNDRFSYIIELRPFDFISFLNSGSSFALFVEKTDWARNLTIIFSNKIFSSTQLITADMLWYFDFLYNAIPIDNIIVPQNFSSPSALERLYPSNRRESIGVSDRFHVYRSGSLAIGLTLYFETLLPKESDLVVSDTTSVSQPYRKDITFSTLGGVFLRYKKNDMEIDSQIMYQRLQGNFDYSSISHFENTLSFKVNLSLREKYFFHLLYYLIFWRNDEYDENLNSHTLNIGAEIKGFGNKLEWIGVGFDIFYQRMFQEYLLGTSSAENGKLDAIIFMPSVNFFPMAFHSKNHNLKVSIYYSQIYYSWDKARFAGAVTESDKGWNYSVMTKIAYSF